MNFGKSRDSLRSTTATKLAIGLGILGLAIGAAELLVPRRAAQSVGIHVPQSGVRVLGAREITSSLGLLIAKDKTPWLWARVAGDVLDMLAIAATGKKRPRVAMSLAAVAGVMMMDALAARATKAEKDRSEAALPDYSDRSGFPLPTQDMRGSARGTFEMPDDMRTPLFELSGK